ncbi:hypothetical protein GCM10023201_02290 [Actinomycetospora corticicola]|uniref:Uncharacterized protein n=1 Tax=Actinomycetospora corticicola TaxID=663602 RepID=A0A7Y9E124_9PSEU|nr:hypothetical protein [Actinomycetospora corticicola]NYD39176.1 hypothetical protein [Actinomycetospora corticicola]
MPRDLEASPTEWSKNVGSALGKIAAISDLQVPTVDTFLEITVPATYVRASGLDGETIEPITVFQPAKVQILFTVNIPERIQKELNPFDLHFGGTRFAVMINYEDHGPVVVARCADDESSILQSHAVMIVREFLQRELAHAHELFLVSVGPSPFHADFSIYPSEAELPDDTEGQYRELIYRRSRGRGPLRYSLALPSSFVAPEGGDRVSLAFSLALYHLTRELSLYYSLSERADIHRDQVFIVSALTDDLIEQYQRRGPWPALKRTFAGGLRTRSVLLRVIEAEKSEAQGRSFASSLIGELSEGDEEAPLLHRELSVARNESNAAELRAARETVDSLESTRKKEFEIAVISLSTLLGGAAGAVVSLLTGS